MTNNTFTCDPHRINLFLDRKLSDDEQAAFESHLTECDDCCRRLESSAASDDVWRHVRDCLGDVDDDSALDSAAGEDVTTSQATILKLLAPTDDDRMIGRWGTYEVVGVVGTGGMGVVLKAFDSALNRYVAIKILAPHLGTSGAAIRRFSREGKAAAAVVHDNVIEIYGVSEAAGLPYLVMPYVRGPSLQRRLNDEGPLAVVEILRVAMQAAAGLAAAHAQGLVHRDVKPANILLADGIERVKLTDFGLARAADDASLTRTGVIAGTPQYMSPEQARGEPVDPRSDLFSLGSVLYAMCTGRPPFRAETSYGVLRRITDEEPRAIREINPDLPDWLCGVIAKLMAKRPDDRFQSAHEVAALLEQCLAHMQQPTIVPLPKVAGTLRVPSASDSPLLPGEGPGVRAATSSRKRSLKGTRAMLTLLGLSLFAIGVATTNPPDISGTWQGDDWGQVTLTQTAPGEYTGTYIDTVVKEKGRGKIALKWSRIERRYNGTWREGDDDRFGDLSIHIVGSEIRGGLTTSDKSKINPATPRLADLRWEQVAASAPLMGFAPSARVDGSAKSGLSETKTHSSDPVTELAALEGPWRLVRIEKGKYADSFWAKLCEYPRPLDPATTSRLNFHLVKSVPHFEIRRLGPPPEGVQIDTRIHGNVAFETPVWFAPLFSCRIDPAAAPKTIDVFPHVFSPFKTPAAQGIYEVEDGRLKIRLTQYLFATAKNQRPNDFAVPADSGDVLLILERYRPSEDEKKIEGTWAVVSQTVDGNQVSKEQFQSKGFSFRDNVFSVVEHAMSGPHVSAGMGKITRNGSYVLDAATRPKNITTHSFGRGTPAREDLFGIYKLEGDRLTIAWGRDGPPRVFESRPGSGITLIEMQKAGGRVVESGPREPAKGEPIPILPSGDKGEAHRAEVSADGEKVTTLAHPNAIHFDGDHYAKLDPPPKFTSGDFSISLWFNPVRSSHFAFPFMRGYSYRDQQGDIALKLNRDSGELDFQARTADREWLFGWDAPESRLRSPVRYGNWNHAVVTRHGEMYTMWMNGALVGTERSSADISDADSTNPFIVGGIMENNGVVDMFHGALDDFRIFHRCLSDQEIELMHKSDGDKVAVNGEGRIMIGPLREAGGTDAEHAEAMIGRMLQAQHRYSCPAFSINVKDSDGRKLQRLTLVINAHGSSPKTTITAEEAWLQRDREDGRLKILLRKGRIESLDGDSMDFDVWVREIPVSNASGAGTKQREADAPPLSNETTAPAVSKLDADQKQETKWTPENIKKDPTGYLRWALDQADATKTRLEAAERALGEQKRALSDKLRKASADKSNYETLFAELKQAYEKAVEKYHWPVSVRNQKFDSSSNLKRRIVECDRDLKNAAKLVETYSTAKDKVTDRLDEIDKEKGKTETLKMQLETDLEAAKVQQTLEGIGAPSTK